MAGKLGGKRPGAGRKPGTANVKTAEIAAKAMAEGITPIEVLLKTMRKLHQASEDGQVVIGNDGETLTPIGLSMMAAEVAAKAAPYCHPRLNAVEVTGKDDSPLVIQKIIYEVIR